MAQLVVRDIKQDVKERLRRRAAEHGRSMEAEARMILTDAVKPPRRSIVAALGELADDVGGIELDIPQRSTLERVVSLDE